MIENNELREIQILDTMEIKCEYINKDSGCLVSFDGSCCKEECFTYRLLQLLQAKEQECEILKSENFSFEELIKYQDEQLEPFNDGYFEHLDTKIIAELAKKSIRLTTENRKLENALDEIEEYINTHLDELAVNKIKDIINGAKDIKVPHKAKEE